MAPYQVHKCAIDMRCHTRSLKGEGEMSGEQLQRVPRRLTTSENFKAITHPYQPPTPKAHPPLNTSYCNHEDPMSKNKRPAASPPARPST